MKKILKAGFITTYKTYLNAHFKKQLLGRYIMLFFNILYFFVLSCTLQCFKLDMRNSEIIYSIQFIKYIKSNNKNDIKIENNWYFIFKMRTNIFRMLDFRFS